METRVLFREMLREEWRLHARLFGGTRFGAFPGFVAGGVGFLVETDWWRPVLLGAAVASTAVILVFWQGGLEMAVQKGILGVVINLAIVGLVASW